MSKAFQSDVKAGLLWFKGVLNTFGRCSKCFKGSLKLFRKLFNGLYEAIQTQSKAFKGLCRTKIGRGEVQMAPEVGDDGRRWAGLGPNGAKRRPKCCQKGAWTSQDRAKTGNLRPAWKMFKKGPTDRPGLDPKNEINIAKMYLNLLFGFICWTSLLGLIPEK